MKKHFLALALVSFNAMAICAQEVTLEDALARARQALQGQAPADIKSQDGVPVEIEGPAAALAFDKSYRDPQGNTDKDKPIPFSDTKHIILMNKDLWSQKQIIEDFKKNKTEGQVAIAVIVKTEYCCDNEYRACAVTTAAFEKFSAPEIKKLRVYGAWIKNDAACSVPGLDSRQAKTNWDSAVIREYAFQQGPGATIMFIDPGTGKTVRTDAQKMGLYQTVFDKANGETPILQKKIEDVLRAFGSGAGGAAGK